MTSSNKMTILKLVTTAAFISWVIIAGINFGNAHANTDSSSSLKVIVKMKYSDWIKKHGMGKAYFHYFDESGDVSKTKDLSKKFPKEVQLQFPSGSVDVGEGFTVVLNSYVCDDASDASGINHPSKKPERISMRFPC